MVQPSFKDLSGRTSLASSHLTPNQITQINLNQRLKRINALSSNSSPSTSPKASATTPMESSDFPHIKIWRKRSSIICGPLRITASSTRQLSVSVLLPERWVRPHMLFSADTTLPRSLVELRASKLSRISRIGLEPGLLRVKVCTMEVKLCRNQVRTPLTQPLSTLVAPSCPSHQMCLKKLEPSGPRPSPTLTVPQTRLSATSRTPARTLLQKWSQSAFKWVTTFSRLTQNNICINQATKSAILLSINADFQVKTRTYSWSVTPSLSTSTQSMTSTATPSALVSTATPRTKSACTNQAQGQVAMTKPNQKHPSTS